MIRYYLMFAVAMLLMGAPAFGQTMGSMGGSTAGPAVRSITVPPPLNLHLNDLNLQSVNVGAPPPEKIHFESHREPVICHPHWIEPIYLYTDKNGYRHYL